MSDEPTKPLVPEVTKHSFRKKIWDHITKNELANFPLSVHKRIPNFKGAAEAAQRLLDLEEFKRARVVKINPDRPQAPIRLLALEAGKEILVPIPRLKSGLFVHVMPSAFADEEQRKSIDTQRGLQEFGKPLGLDSKIKVDLVVLGSVCVSRSGHRIGKGEGFADLEFAVMRRLGAVDDSTTVITTVHDCQLLDDLPASLFEKFDVPVDVIVTPTQTIFVSERLRKPAGIYWDILTPRRVKSMQVLQELQRADEQEGKIVVLREEESSDERRAAEKKWSSKRPKRRPRRKREDAEAAAATGATNAEGAEQPGENDDRDGVKRGRAPRRRRLREPKGGGGDGGESPSNETETAETRREKPRRRRYLKPRVRANIDFTLKLTNIKSHHRVRHLKDALVERGVHASDISWHGIKGHCYLHFGKLRNRDSQPDQPVQVDSIVANLQQLRLGDASEPGNDEFIVVEPAKPITRIEITDVTAV